MSAQRAKPSFQLSREVRAGLSQGLVLLAPQSTPSGQPYLHKELRLHGSAGMEAPHYPTQTLSESLKGPVTDPGFRTF